MKTYEQIKEEHPILVNCFFAFSNTQMAEGIAKFNLQGVKLYSGIGGLYGTKEGIKQLYDFYDNQTKEIAENCDPQIIYDYEFSNHECGYTNDDSEAFAIVSNIFPKEKLSSLKRKFAHSNI